MSSGRFSNVVPRVRPSPETAALTAPLPRKPRYNRPEQADDKNGLLGLFLVLRALKRLGTGKSPLDEVVQELLLALGRGNLPTSVPELRARLAAGLPSPELYSPKASTVLSSQACTLHGRVLPGLPWRLIHENQAARILPVAADGGFHTEITLLPGPNHLRLTPLGLHELHRLDFTLHFFKHLYLSFFDPITQSPWQPEHRSLLVRCRICATFTLRSSWDGPACPMVETGQCNNRSGNRVGPEDPFFEEVLR